MPEPRPCLAPTAPPLCDRIGADIASVLAGLGLDPVGATPVTGLPGQEPYVTLKVDLREGGAVKVRRLRRPGRSRRAAALLRALGHPGLAPPLALEGSVSVERWVEGTTLSDLPLTRERLHAAADLLGGLHAARRVGPRPLRLRASTASLVRHTRRRLVTLLAGGVIDRPLADALLAVLTRAPLEAAAGLTHQDLCAENLIEDPAGRLRSIDNEYLQPGFIDYDLGRVWYRWPMSGADWDAFVHRCRSWREGPPAVAPIWKVAATVRGAHVRFLRGVAQLGDAVRRLREVVQEGNS